MGARQRCAGVAVAAFVMAVAAGCGLGGGEPRAGAAAPLPVSEPVADSAQSPAGDDPLTADDATPAPPTPTGSPSARPEATKEPAAKTGKPATRTPSKKPSAKATTAPADQFWDQKPACADYEGTAVSKKAAKAALTSAAGRTYWPTSAPKLKVPTDVVTAIAWQESGWQSNIVNCDGGFGLMQTMPDTVAFVNQRFEKEYDARDHRQNAVIGANYLAWLTKKFGDNYFGKRYDLSTRACRDHADLCLLNMVISAYNAGDGSVEQSHRAGELPNPAYVDSVRSLMKRCYCDRY